MNENTFAMPLYKATNDENHQKLVNILKKHVPTLREYELIADSPAYLLESENGVLIETFEWRDQKAKEVAHEHPAIRTIWGEMEGICEFPSLGELPEARTRFPNFRVLEKY